MSKDPNNNDPFAKREAKNYANPIASRELILQHLETVGEPTSYTSLCQQLGLTNTDDAEALRRRLIAMSRDGQLISNRRGVYGLPAHMDLIKGRVQGHKDGFGFFVPMDGSVDLFLSVREMSQVFDGDIVLARVSGVDNRGRKEGMIAEVLERRSNQIVGRYYWEHEFGVVVPDNRRIAHEILVPERHNRGAEDGQFVVAEITTFPSSRRKPVARVVEILGDSTTPGLETDIAIRSHDIPHIWTSGVKNELVSFSTDVEEVDRKGRIDLRKVPFVTIDGEDAKDFDDAVFAEPLKGGKWRLLVAIADVSHYVSLNCAIDAEAKNRGNSVYFPGHVVPMLPEKLSNGLCSLNPGVNRLVMVCEMEFSARGDLTNYAFSEAVMHSHARLTYTEVADMLMPAASDAQRLLQIRLRARHETIVPHLKDLYALFKVLRSARERSGALDFASTETRIVFGEDRKIKEIVPVMRTDAHRMIEEFMLCANVAAATLLEESDLPALYRIHQGPNPDKLDNLRQYLREMGVNLPGGDKPEPKDYQSAMQQIADRPDAHLLHKMLIRSMMQAVYQPENMGHFGLGYPAYTHFTSPIRRYPDLLVHRAIRYLIHNKSNKHLTRAKGVKKLSKQQIYPYNLLEMQSLGELCSMTERRADAASYDVIDWLKCEYIQDRVGDEFNGTISSVTGFGIFVELDDIYVEGLVHITELHNDYYHFDPVRHSLVGERSNKVYCLGDTVKVKVVRVSLDDKKIDLQIVGELSKAGSVQRKRNNSGGAGKRHGKGRKQGKAEAAARSDSKSGNKSGSKSSSRSGSKPGSKPSNKSGSNSNNKPGNKSGNKQTAKKAGNASKQSPAGSSKKTAKKSVGNKNRSAGSNAAAKTSTRTTAKAPAKKAASKPVAGKGAGKVAGKKAAAKKTAASKSAGKKTATKKAVRTPAKKAKQSASKKTAAKPAAKKTSSSRPAAGKKAAPAKKRAPAKTNRTRRR